MIDKSTNSLCDETFFRNRIYEKYANIVRFKTSDITWKKYYFKNMYYIDKLEKKYEFKFTKESRGTPEQYYKIMANIRMEQFEFIIKNKFYDLLDFYIPSLSSVRYIFYYNLAKYGEIEYFDKMLHKYNDCINSIGNNQYAFVGSAILYKQFLMLEYLISRGISKERVLNLAIYLDSTEVVEYIRNI